MSPAQLPFGDLESVLNALSNAPLDSASLDSKPMTAALTGSLSFESEHLPKVTLNLRAGVEISLFNSADDKDADGILVPAGAKDVFGGATPVLELSSGHAWLKYRYDAGLKASAGKTLADIGFTLAAEGGASTILGDYRAHPRSQPAREAVMADVLDGPRFAAVLSHVEALAPEDAVSLQLAGSLKVSLELSWSDVFTGQLAPLSALLKSSAPIGITFDAGATVTVNVSVADDFVAVFSRVDAETWRIAIKKASARTIRAGLEAGVEISFADPHAVESIAQRVVDGLLGVAFDTITPLLDAAALADLNGQQRAIATLLIRRLGLDEATATLAGLRTRIGDVRAKIDDAIAEVVRSKVAPAFAYEYRRVSASSHLLQATLSRERLRALHDACIRGNLRPALDAIVAKAPGIALVRYLNERKVERTESWGFTLGIGKWVNIGGTDTRRIVPIVRTNIDKQRQESYLGFRGYEGRWVGESFKWSADFKADMAGFAAEPRASDFAFGLHLLWQQTIKSLSEDDVDLLLDAAVLWGVLTQLDAAQLRPQLIAHAGKKCGATVQMTIADTDRKPTLRTVLAALSAAPSVAGALGAAMPWRAGSVGRTHVAIRRTVYAPLWQMYLDKPDMSPSELAASANRVFAGGDFADLGHLELNFQAARPFTVAGLAELNDDTPGRARAFCQALETLHRAIDNRAPSQSTLGPVFHDLSGFWEQSHHVRAAGSYLLEAANTAAVLDGVERAATFTVDGATLVLG